MLIYFWFCLTFSGYGKSSNYYGLTFIITLVALHNVTSREKAGFVSLVKSLIHGWLKMVMTTSAGRLL